MAPQAWRRRGFAAGGPDLLSICTGVTQLMSQPVGRGVSAREMEVCVMARIGLEHRRTWFVRMAEWGSRRKYGKVPDPGKVALHNRGVLVSTLLMEGSAARWKTLDPGLKALAVMVVSARIGCSWCMDFGYWEFHHQGVDPAKLRDVPGWRNSDA